MKFIGLEFEGRDAHAVSTYLCLFEQEFKTDPLEAAMQLESRLRLLVEATLGSTESVGNDSDRVVSLRDRWADRVSRSAAGRNYPDPG